PPLPPPAVRPAALGPTAGPPGAPRLPASRTRAGRALLLTFDDGPDPRYTPGILALLEAYDARAVFCVVGQEALEHPDLVRAIVAAGHDLCNHSTHHDMTLATRPGPVIRADLVRTQAILRGITGGVVPRLMRAPGGRWSPTLVAEAEALSLEPLSWSVDSRDWSKPGLREIVARVLGDAQPGGVVLMHDGGGDRSRTLVALPFLLRRLSQLGYAFR
ncbi:MAG TPA: polysaccharide deacetylase family protein, partial [Mycobacteriales bacterium]|nr:polysaccharide deacetylase family protein [Mycobacteriales bacterium]